MKQQPTLAMAAGFEKHAKRTRRAKFLAQRNAVVPWRELVAEIVPWRELVAEIVPWRELVAEIEPFSPGTKARSRPPVEFERMLRMYFLERWFNLSDPGVEEALYESLSMRHFVGTDLGSEPAPDETTVCKFRHLLEGHGLPPHRRRPVRGNPGLGAKPFERVNRYLSGQG